MAKEIVTRVAFSVQGQLLIADPCYIDEDDQLESLGDLGVILDDCEGTWVAEVKTSDEGDWGDRVSVLRATRQGFETSPFTSSHELLGHNGVDSGQMFIGCAGAFPLNYNAVLERYKKSDGEWDDDLHFFGFGEGAISATGYGDGSYPVYVQRDVRGRPVVVEVRFMESEDEEDEEN